MEQITGLPVLQIQVKQDELARYDVSARAVLDLVESLGSKPLGEVVEGQLRFPLVVRLPETARASPQAIGAIAADDAGRRAGAAVAAGRSWSWSKGRPRSPANGASGASRCSATSTAATWAVLWPRRRSEIDAEVKLPPRPLSPRMGRPVREPGAGQDAAADRGAGGAGADLRAAVHHLQPTGAMCCWCSRRCRSPASGGVLALWLRGLAVLDLGRRRLHRPVRRVGAQQHGAGDVHPPAARAGACRWTGRSRRRR